MGDRMRLELRTRTNKHSRRDLYVAERCKCGSHRGRYQLSVTIRDDSRRCRKISNKRRRVSIQESLFIDILLARYFAKVADSCASTDRSDQLWFLATRAPPLRP